MAVDAHYLQYYCFIVEAENVMVTCLFDQRCINVFTIDRYSINKRRDA